MKHNTNLEAVNTTQEHKPSCVMQARRGGARWPWHPSAWGRSLCILPEKPCCASTHPNSAGKIYMTTAERTPPPAPAQSSHSQGSENSAMPVRRGRKKKEPFQEKGGQPAQPSAIEDPRAEGALQGEVALHAGTCNPPQEPCRALGQQLRLLLTVK